MNGKTKQRLERTYSYSNFYMNFRLSNCFFKPQFLSPELQSLCDVAESFDAVRGRGTGGTLSELYSVRLKRRSCPISVQVEPGILTPTEPDYQLTVISTMYSA